jgi:hypothetical protein
LGGALRCLADSEAPPKKKIIGDWSRRKKDQMPVPICTLIPGREGAGKTKSAAAGVMVPYHAGSNKEGRRKRGQPFRPTCSAAVETMHHKWKNAKRLISSHPSNENIDVGAGVLKQWGVKSSASKKSAFHN